ncbi:MAG: 2-oxoglutarate oxidoreductase subunit KorA, partial [Microgenomates bacterium OLB23]
TKAGYNTASYAEYPSLIRGGHNTFEIHISPKENSIVKKKKIDVLVCLNPDTYNFHKERLGDESRIIYDKELFPADFQAPAHSIEVPIKKIVRDLKGSTVMMNTVAVGASIALLQWRIQDLFEMIEQAFGDKGEEIVAMNKSLAQAGYDHVMQYAKEEIITEFAPKTITEPQMVMTGNDAFSLGAVTGDCRLYVAYPMTPSSTVIERLASWAETTGMVVRHAEDEISVIMTALGGSFGGVRSACGTSGGGFALMNEAVSLAGIAEVPLVIFLSQRPGPATGLPTWTEQGDLLYAVHSGHGEFPKIIIAPGDVEEMYEMTADAFNLADIYQTPVIVMSDKHLSESYWSTSKMAYDLFSKSYQIERGKIVRSVEDEAYLRYKLTDDGISPMLIPGQEGRHYQTNSYEHDEYGHSFEGAENRKSQVEKRDRKNETYLKTHFKVPQTYGNLEEADDIFVTWGSNKGVILDAMEYLEGEKKKVAMIHFTHVFPLDADVIAPLFKHKGRYILVENNSRGQFGRLLRQETGIHIEEKLLKYDGRQFFVEEIINYITARS